MRPLPGTAIKLPYTGMTRIRFEGTLSARQGTPAYGLIQARSPPDRQRDGHEPSAPGDQTHCRPSMRLRPGPGS